MSSICWGDQRLAYDKRAHLLCKRKGPRAAFPPSPCHGAGSCSPLGRIGPKAFTRSFFSILWQMVDLSLPILRAIHLMDFPCATQLGYAVFLLWA